MRTHEIAEHGLAQHVGELAEELVRKHQRQTVLARLRENGGKAVGGEVLELVGVKGEVAAFVLWEVGAGFGRLRESGRQERAQRMRRYLAEIALGDGRLTLPAGGLLTSCLHASCCFSWLCARCWRFSARRQDSLIARRSRR